MLFGQWSVRLLHSCLWASTLVATAGAERALQPREQGRAALLERVDVATSHSATGPTTFVFPTLGIQAEGKALLLAIDDYSLPLRRNMCYFFSKPAIRKKPVLTPNRADPNAPDSLAAHFYGTVLLDQGKFRMWYYACHFGRNPDWRTRLKTQADRWRWPVIPGPLCYAESSDGIHWVKPDLHQLLFKGGRSNNALALPSALTANACVIRDPADPDPDRRYKMAFWTQYDPWDYPTMRLATSRNGLVWKAAPKPPIAAFLEHASFYRHQGLYIVNAQTFLPGVNGRQRGRQGAAWISLDSRHWLPECAESFVLPRVDSPHRTEVHLGVGAASFGNVVVGLYGMWHNDPDFGKISADLGLVVSNDGVKFREPVKGYVFLSSKDSPVSPLATRSCPTVLCQANGILNVGNQTRIYHGRWRNVGRATTDETARQYYAEVALATLPRDRWGALGLVPGQQRGSIWSAPVTLPRTGCRVVLNVDGARAITVEVANERFELLPEFSGKQQGRLRLAGGLDCPVEWPAGNLQALAGRTVRFHVRLTKQVSPVPRLYAIYLRAVTHQTAGKKALKCDSETFSVRVGGRTIEVRVLLPDAARQVARPGLLLTFAGARDVSLLQEPYCLPARAFLRQGHRVASFDLPNHGARVNRFGQGIAGFRNAFVAGEDPFAQFVSDGKAVLDACIRRGLATPGRIVVGGTSRGGYMALRLLAEDARIIAGAGFAPVTDWRGLREFSRDSQRADVANLRLTQFAQRMTGRRIYLAIGKNDQRVGTDRCRRLFDTLRAGRRKTFHPVDHSPDGSRAKEKVILRPALARQSACYNNGVPAIVLNLTENVGHTMNNEGYQRGVEFLLDALARQ